LDRLSLPAVRAQCFERRCDVFDDRREAQLRGNDPAEPQRIGRRIALGHQQTEDLRVSKCARTERCDYGAVDAAGQSDDGSASAKHAKDTVAQERDDARDL
jgi:hypothetical protein